MRTTVATPAVPPARQTEISSSSTSRTAEVYVRYRHQVRKLVAAICLVVVAIVPACSKNREPNSLFDAAGYHVRGDTVYYLHAFPGEAFEIGGADAASFEVLDGTYARDKSTVYIDGRPLEGADSASFELLDRPNFAKDAKHVFQRDQQVSDDPAHFELLDADLAKDGAHVYWSDGSVLSDDPEHFVIVSHLDHYLFTRDNETVHVNGVPIAGAVPASFRVLGGAYSLDDRAVYYFADSIPDADAPSLEVLAGPYARDAARAYWMGKPIPGADPDTFAVLNANFECTTDSVHAYYQDTEIADAHPKAFPPGKAVTECSATSITFAE